jgi:RimJ/RimL family protein N-acetyltransferase
VQTAPRDELDIGDVVLDASHVEELERALVEMGRERWTIFVRDPNGVCVGGTEIQFAPWDADVARQQNTAIDPAHRGHGLAKWAKAVMLDRMRNERPEVERVRTGNAFSNAPMLAINNALGFEEVERRTEWQASVGALREALGSI